MPVQTKDDNYTITIKMKF